MTPWKSIRVARAVRAKAATVSGSPVWPPPICDRSRCRQPATTPTTAAPTNQMIVARVIDFRTGSLWHRSPRGPSSPPHLGRPAVDDRVEVSHEPGLRLVAEVRVARVAARAEGHDPAARVAVGEVPDVARDRPAVAVLGHTRCAGGGEDAALVAVHRVTRDRWCVPGCSERMDRIQPVALAPRSE